MEFLAWPKTPRLSNARVVVTEKIDGTNGAIIIESKGVTPRSFLEIPEGAVPTTVNGNTFFVGAQSRKRLLVPGKNTDNFGFARWVHDNAYTLADLLGDGRHYGEWWGLGIQSGYSMEHKVFSLFQADRWRKVSESRPDWFDRALAINMDTVPTLYAGKFHAGLIEGILDGLRFEGSVAAHEYGKKWQAEGIIVNWLDFDNARTKSFVKDDDIPKGATE